MSSQIFVEPGITSAEVINVGGQCYRYAGDSDVEPDTFAIDGEPDECCVPAPCVCPNPSDQPATLTVSFSAGSATKDGHTATWGAQTFSILQTGICSWTGPSNFLWSMDGVPQPENGGVFVFLDSDTDVDGNYCFGACAWLMKWLPVYSMFFVSTTGDTPDAGSWSLGITSDCYTDNPDTATGSVTVTAP
jgi:hypothetical protein